MVKRILIVDGDVIAFKAAAAAQQELRDEAGYLTPFANKAMGEAVVHNMLWGLKRGLEADDMVVFVSAPTNFRHQIAEDYKGTRNYDILSRPLLLGHLKQYLRDEFGAAHLENLEADDAVSLAATSGLPDFRPDEAVERVVVGRDKDFKCIPGKHHQLNDITPSGKMIVRDISQEEADRWHMFQTLKGDAIDGYSGCPACGDVKANSIVYPEDGIWRRLVAQPYVKRAGVNKGQATTKWTEEPCADLWAVVVSHFERQGLTEQDALTQARLAHLLRAGEYDFRTGEVTLWTADKLTSALKG
jgi:DNA polymerase-1